MYIYVHHIIETNPCTCVRATHHNPNNTRPSVVMLTVYICIFIYKT